MVRSVHFWGWRHTTSKMPKTHNRGVYQEPMPADLRKRLIDYYAPHNQELYDYLGMRFEWDR